MGDDTESTIDCIVRILNEALEADPEAIQALHLHKVSCNERIANHPTIQVSCKGTNRLRILGLINGFVLALSGGEEVIASEWDTNPEGEDSVLKGFHKVPYAHFGPKERRQP